MNLFSPLCAVQKKGTFGLQLFENICSYHAHSSKAISLEQISLEVPRCQLSVPSTDSNRL